MSGYYDMCFEITDFNEEFLDDIKEAVNREWQVKPDDWIREDNQVTVSSEGSLTGGEYEDELPKRLARAVWKANRGYCHVLVRATYLEDLPYNDYEMDKEKYKVLMGNEIDDKRE